MAVPARLVRGLRTKLGSDAGEDLVSWLDETRAEHLAAMARLDETNARLDAMETRLTDRMHALEVKMGDVQSNLLKWSFVFWCGAVAAVAALAGVLRAP